MKYKVLKSLITPILGLSAIGTIAITSTSCGNEQHSDEQPISEPSLDKSTLNLVVGNKEVINVLGLDNKEASVTWSSSDESLAIVQEESGNSTSIIANSEGKTGDVKITAAVDIAGNISELTCNVNVMIVPLVSIKIVPSTTNITTKSTTNFTIECTPTNASIKSVEVASKEKRIANPMVDDNKSTTFKVQGLNEGNTTITAYVNDYSGKKLYATCKVNVKQGLIPVTGVELDVDEFTIRVDEPRKLKATVLPENATNKEVTWKSNNDEVAIVDQNGKVTPQSEGETTIVVTTKDGEHKAECTVHVIQAQRIPVESVKLNKSSLDLTTIGQSEQLTATILPKDASNKNITWDSDDKSIATVDQDGKVTAIATGKTTITVTTEDGYNKATCDVNVAIPVTGVLLNKNDLELALNYSDQLIATVLPEDATNKNVSWSSSDDSIVSVDENGNIKGIKLGDATITVTTEDGEISETCTVNVKNERILGYGEFQWGDIKVKCKLLSSHEARLLTKDNDADDSYGYVEGKGILKIPDYVTWGTGNEKYYVKQIPSDWSNGENNIEGIEFASDVSHLTEICDEAFYNTNALSNYDRKVLVFPEGLKRIGNQAFYGTVHWMEVDFVITGYTFPSTLQSIGDRAFANTHALGYKNSYLEQLDVPTSLVFKNEFNPKNFGEKAFSPQTGKNWVQCVYAPTLESATSIADYIKTNFESDFSIGDDSFIPKQLEE